jgi:DNA invertase Pin-like site-specific DNA recombinase
MNKPVRCAIYTRKSTEEGLEQDFNSLDAQREACEAYIQSQRGLGWVVCRKRYDDGGLSGGTMDRPALKALLSDIEKGKVDLVIVYKVDRLTRSLMDFAKIIETFDTRSVSFVSVTQQFNTANSMGRLTLNVLLSFAQFEREVTAERIRDKISASKKKGMWMGGLPPLGYDAVKKKLVINEDEASVVRALYDIYLELRSVRKLKSEADRRGYVTKHRRSRDKLTGGKPFTRGHLYQLLHNPIYVGQIPHKGNTYPGLHEGVVERRTWDTAQKILDEQAPARRSPSNTKQICLLTGLLFDETGDRLSPSYCRKGKRRYRYYISKHLVHGDDKSGGWRIPASALEEAVLLGLCRFLQDGRQVADALYGIEATPTQIQASVRAARKFAKVIEQARLDEIVEPVRKIIEGVTIAPSRIRLKISRSGLAQCVGNVCAGEDHPMVLDLPISIRRRGFESKIILPGTSMATFHDRGLINLIADVCRWFEWIVSGEVATVREISREVKIDEGDVSRFLPLAFLAPDIVEAILDGKQPPELTAEKLKRLRSMPKSWEEQHWTLGFID